MLMRRARLSCQFIVKRCVCKSQAGDTGGWGSSAGLGLLVSLIEEFRNGLRSTRTVLGFKRKAQVWARRKTSAAVWRRGEGRRKGPCHFSWHRPAAALQGGGLFPNVERNSQGVKESTLYSTRETRKEKLRFS